MVLHLRRPVGVEQSGLFLPHRMQHFIGEGHVRALVAEHPIRAGSQARQQAARSQEIHIGKGAKEEQSLDAAREAGQVEQELAPILAGIDAAADPATESVQRWQNCALRRIDGILSMAANARARCS